MEVAVGAGAEGLAGAGRARRRHRCPGGCSRTGQPLRLSHPSEQPGLPSLASGSVDVGPVLVVPLPGATAMHGVLNLVRLRRAGRVHRRGPGHGGRLRQPGRRRDRTRQAPARSSNAARCSTNANALPRTCTTTSSSACSPPGCRCRHSPPPSARAAPTDRVMSTVSDLDATISQIRTAIFQLQQTSADQRRAGCARRLLDVVGELAPALGFDPAVRFSGVLDTFPTTSATTCSPSLREALTNIARHARARTAEIDLTAHDGPGHAHRPGRRHRRRRHHAPQRPGQHAPPRRAARRRLRARTGPRQRHPAHLDRAPGLLTPVGRRVVDQASSETRRCATASCSSSTSRTSPSTCSRTPAASVRVVRIA